MFRSIIWTIALSCLVAFINVSSIHATTLNVPADHASIEAALAAAAAGDTIQLAPGTYQESNLAVPVAVVLRGATGIPEDVIWDCQQSGHLVAENLSSLVVAGISFRNTAWNHSIHLIGGPATVRDCRFEGGSGAGYIRGEEADLQLHGCTFVGGGPMYSYGGGVNIEQGSLDVQDCEFIDFHLASLSGGGVHYNNQMEGQQVTITDCLFQGNLAVAGHACTIRAQGPGQNATIQGCQFVGNGESGGSIIQTAFDGDLIIDQCTFVGNHGSPIGTHGTNVVMTSSTLAYNFSSVSHGVIEFVGNTNQSSFQNCIIAFNQGFVSVKEANGGALEPFISCTNIYGNTDGDWLDGFAHNLGSNGNIWMDPLFCDGPGGDLQLQPGSPCLPGAFSPGCDLMGSLADECGQWSGIMEITDVPNDQGGQLRVQWAAHGSDVAGSVVPITEYSLWRRIEGQGSGLDLRHPPGDWEHLLTVPAVGEPSYAAVFPTLCDSTAAGGVCWTRVHMIAHTENPLSFYESAPDSGYSVDNIHPAVPGGLILTGPTVLTWESCPDADFQHFTVYASDDGILDASDALVGHTIDTSLDFGPDAPAYLLVTATDVAGNESAAAALLLASGVGDNMPTVLALHGAVPNPFNPTTTIGYAIPEAGHARLAVYDLRGKLVATLLDGPQPVGRGEVLWHGTDGEGRGVPSGVYLSRLESGGQVVFGRMSLVR